PRLLSLRHLPHPRALHSFPTRRSSDLAAVGISRGLRSRQRHVEDRVVREYGERGEQQRARRRFQNRRSDAELGFSFHFSSLLSRDRKSTRLNSSHVKISYAVFCLKKKN